MNSNYRTIAVVLLSFFLANCARKDIDADASGTYILLFSKTETTVLGRTRIVQQTDYEYDTLNAPILKEEVTGKSRITYEYPSKSEVIVRYLDNTTSQIYSQMTLKIDPASLNVIKQIDEDKSEHKFEYDAAGYLTKDPFDASIAFEYKEGNLVSKISNTTDVTQSENYLYGTIDNKPVVTPYFFGKPNKKLLSEINITTVNNLTKNKTTATSRITYVLDDKGYVETKRQELPNGAFIETTYTYHTISK
jgi:hypothetical protein